MTKQVFRPIASLKDWQRLCQDWQTISQEANQYQDFLTQREDFIQQLLTLDKASNN